MKKPATLVKKVILWHFFAILLRLFSILGHCFSLFILPKLNHDFHYFGFRCELRINEEAINYSFLGLQKKEQNIFDILKILIVPWKESVDVTNSFLCHGGVGMKQEYC